MSSLKFVVADIDFNTCYQVLYVTQTPSHGTNVTTLVNVTDIPTHSPTIVAYLKAICGTATTQDLWIKHVRLNIYKIYIKQENVQFLGTWLLVLILVL